MKKLLIAASLVVLMSLPALAQDTTLPKTSPAPAAQPETPAVHPAAPAAPAPQAEAPSDKMLGDKSASASSYAGQISAKQLLNESIKNAANETVGDINDITLGSDGKITAVIVGVGGFLGMGDKLFAIPWGALTLAADNKCFVLNVAKERLENAPGFDKEHWPSMADMTWAREIHGYYGMRPYWE